MRKLIFLLLGFFIWQSALSQVSANTPLPLRLPQWAAGNKLNAGTANDTTIANSSLNQAFAKINATFGRYINNFGYFTSIVSPASTNLVINPGDGTVGQVNIAGSDSLSVGGNITGLRDMLISGNVTVGGYITTDSLLGKIVADTINASYISTTRIIATNGIFYQDVTIGSSFGNGILNLSSASGDLISLYGSNTDARVITFPDISGGLALIDGDQNLTDIGTIAFDGGSISGTGNTGLDIITVTSGNPFIDFQDGATLKANIYWDRTNSRLTINDASVGETYIGSPLSMSLGNNILLNGNYLSGDGGDEGISVDANGNVGIGTMSPQVKLDVNGDIRSQYITLTGGAIEQWATNGLDQISINYNGYNGGSTQFRDLAVYNGKNGNIAFFQGITSNVGIGTTTPDSNAHINLGLRVGRGFLLGGTARFSNYGAGAATFDANGVISSVSDERLKIIDGKFKKGLKELLTIEPIKHHWKKESGLDTENQYVGFSAQNVNKTIPEATFKNKDGYYTFQDRVVLAASVNAIKELKTIIDSLQSRLSKLGKKK